MSSVPSAPGRLRAAWPRARTGAALVLGWSTFEAVVFATSGDPTVCGELLPGWAALVLAGGIVGAASARLAWLPVALAVPAAAAALAQRTGLLHLSPIAGHLPQALCALALALLVVLAWQRRTARGALHVPFALGLLASQAFAAFHQGWMPHHAVLLPLALGLLLLALLPRRAWRVAGTLLALGLTLVPIGQRVLPVLRLPRGDLPPPEAAVAGRANLVLIVMDTVRADRLSCYGYERATTPGLDAFAREDATRYEHARATASWTLPSHASLFTGLLPGEHGADHPRGADRGALQIGTVRPACALRPDVPTLAERLRAAGYRTAAVVANEAYLDHRFGIDRGFERYDDRQGSYVRDYLALPQMLGWRVRIGHFVYRDARRIAGLGRAWVEALPPERPFFLMLNLMDAHQPVLPPAPFDRAFAPETPADPLAPRASELSLQYDRGLAALDAEIARLLDWLRQSGRFERTVVIVTGDHGEAFGERGGFYDHAYLLYEELLHVPLLVKPAGPRSKALEPEPFGLAEVYRLALRLTGVADEAAPPGRPAGEWYRGPSNADVERWARSVGHDLESDLVTWLEGETKFIVSSKGEVEAYDLAQDPGELAPLALSAERAAQAADFARAWWEAHPPLHSAAPAALDAEQEERMRALGYAGEAPGPGQ